MRSNNRKNDELREINFIKDYIEHAEGSVLVSFGNTKVLCTATIEEKLPVWLKGKGKGWITAEYSLLPRSTSQRNQREAVRGKQTGRTVEIQRLIGRSLRACIDLSKIGERNIIVDCDVIQADGGTRTASITGAFAALEIAINKLLKQDQIKENPIIHRIAAVSVGIVDGMPMLDLNYEEDFKATVDMNIVMTDNFDFIELQGTGEEAVYSHDELLKLLEIGKKGITDILNIQSKI